MATFAIQGDAIRCLEGERGSLAPGAIVGTPDGFRIETGPSIDGLGLEGTSAPTREALIEALEGSGHTIVGA